MRRLLLITFPSIALVFNSGCENRAAHEQLVAVPEPAYDRLEPAVRDQLKAARAPLEEMLSREHPQVESLPRLFGQQGKLYFAYRFFPGAKACFINARRLAPEDYRWAYYLASALRVSAEDSEESRIHFEAALELNPEYLPTYIALSELLVDDKRLKEAEELLQQALELDSASAATFASLGMIAAKRNQHAQAIEYLERARKLAPEATSLLYPLGLAYRDQGDTNKAQYYLERAGNVSPQLVDPLFDSLRGLMTGSQAAANVAQQYTNQGRFKDALKYYRKAVAATPNDPKTRVNLAAVLSRLNRIESAMEQLRQVLRLDPAHLEANYNMATLLARQGRDQDAIGFYERALERDSGRRETNFNMASALLRLRRYEEAREHFARVVDAAPMDATARFALAKSLVNLQRWQEARALLEEGREILPQNARLAEALARLLAACPVDSLRDGNRALKIASRVVSTERTMFTVEAHAMSLAEMGRFDEAVALQEECLAVAQREAREDLQVVLKRNMALYQKQLPSRRPFGE